jgi:hypothetical protein
MNADLLIDFSFDELNDKNNVNNNNMSNKNNLIFTCSTPRQSNDMDNQNLENYSNIDDDALFVKPNNIILEKPDISCDLLRSSKIDFDLNSVCNDDNDNTDADITTSNLTNSIYSNLNINRHQILSRKASNIEYKSPVNQMNNLLKNLRVNYKNNDNECDNNNNNNNFDDDSLILSKLENDLSFNSIIFDNSKKYLRNNNNNNINSINNVGDLKIILEKEVLKRQHCEKQIEELNKKLLQLDEQLAVVTALDRKKEQFINKLDKNLTKVILEPHYFLKFCLSICGTDFESFRFQRTILNIF